MKLEQRWILPLYLCISLLAIVLVWIVPGTGDGGDSIQHYLTAKYAFENPAFFFDLWAKPVYMFFAAPLSQFGFRTLMLGNVILGLLCGWLVYRCAERLGLTASGWGMIFLFSISGFVPQLYSGLTEPIFAFVLILSLYLALGERLSLAVVVISFLPFVRNEGWAIVAVYLVWLMIERRWRLLPLLGIGAVVISLMGYPFHQKWNWIYTAIPDIGASNYGEGSFWHFFDQLNYVIGIPLYGLLIIGGIALIVSVFREAERQKVEHWLRFLWLVAGGFSAFFLAHTLAWWLPGLKSMGLDRVLVGVLPLAILIVLYGWQWLIAWLPEKLQPWIAYAIAAYVIIFPFLPNPAAYNWQRDFQLSPDQVIAQEAVALLEDKYADFVWYHEHPYYNYLAERNPFDPNHYHRLIGAGDFSGLPTGTPVIWDSWFSVVEAKRSLEEMRNQPSLEEVRVIRYPSEEIYSEIVIFVRK
ncbi:MAG: hypothetical protein AAFQ68_11990 [Bacteroidota bacterium]